jgi:hypothetical protein
MRLNALLTLAYSKEGTVVQYSTVVVKSQFYNQENSSRELQLVHLESAFLKDLDSKSENSRAAFTRHQYHLRYPDVSANWNIYTHVTISTKTGSSSCGSTRVALTTFCTVRYCTVLYGTILHYCTVLHCTVLDRVSNDIIQCNTVQYCTVL